MSSKFQTYHENHTIVIPLAKDLTFADIDDAFKSAYDYIESGKQPFFVIFDASDIRKVPLNLISYVAQHPHAPAYHKGCERVYVTSASLLIKGLTRTFNAAVPRMRGKIGWFPTAEEALKDVETRLIGAKILTLPAV